MRRLINKIKSMRFDVRVFLIIFILILNFILLFKPDLLNNKSSYASIRTKKNLLNETNRDIVEEIDSNNDKTMEIGELRERDAEYEKRALVNKKEVDVNGLTFHLPSILIRLEDSARANGLELAINYSEISYENLEGEEVEEEEDSEEIDEEQEQEEIEEEDVSADPRMNVIDEIEENVETGGETEDIEEIDEEYLDERNKIISREDQEQEGGTGLLTVEEEEEKEEQERVEQERDSDTNIEVTKIPISVKGTYAGVRGFINDLDRLNYIEPSRVEMVSEGDIVSATITISIFHGNIFE